MRYAATLLVPLALGACAINAPALGPAVPYDPGYLRISVADDVQPEDRQAVQELVDATLQVITSDDFRDNLVRLDGATSRLWLSPYGETMSLDDVARIYRGEHQSVRPVPTRVQVNHGNSTPSQGFYYQPEFHSRITLTSDVLTRWRSDSMEQKACAVNTLAHEISHTFSSSTTQGEWVIADAGKGRWPSFLYGALASYTIGSVAQCTMLLAHEPQYEGLGACLLRWGMNRFNSLECGSVAGASS